MIRRLLPVISQQELAINRRYSRIVAKGALIQGKAVRAFIPDFFPNIPQMGICTVEMDKRQVVANVPDGLTLFWHQTEAIRPPAILPAARRFVVALVAVSDIQAESMVIAILRNVVTFI